MGVLRIKISDTVEEVLRDVVPNRKGALGKFIEEAVVEKIKSEYPELAVNLSR